MADNKTTKSKYQSRYGGGYITAAQYITELTCEHAARATKRNLADFFWNDPIWKKDFLAQLNHANKLLKIYEPATIISVLQSKTLRYKKLTSLGAKWLLEPLLQAEHKKNTMLAAKIDIVELPDFDSIDSTVVRKPPKKKSKLEGL